MFCSKCGNQIPDGAKFCGKCGTRTDGDSGVAAGGTRIVIGGAGGAGSTGGGTGYSGAGYSGTGYSGTGYSGAGYSGAGYSGAGYGDAGGYDYRVEKKNPVMNLLAKLNKKVLIIVVVALVVIVAGVVGANLIFGGSSGSGGGDALVFVQDNVLMLAEKPGDDDFCTLNDEYLSDEVLEDTSYDAGVAAKVGSFAYSSDGKYLFYLADYDSYSEGHLYQVKLSGLKAGKESQNITSVAKNVEEFVVVGDYVYYRKRSGALCCYDMSQSRSVTIEKNAGYSYYVSEDGELVLYTNEDGDLYLSDATGAKEVRIAKDISCIDHASEDLGTVTYETYDKDKDVFSLFTVSVKNFEVTSTKKRLDDVGYVEYADVTRVVYSEREEDATGEYTCSMVYVDGDLTQTIADDCMGYGVEAARDRSGFPTGYYRIAKYAFAEPELLLMAWTEGDYEKIESYNISVNGGPAKELDCDYVDSYAYDAEHELLYLSCANMEEDDDYKYEYTLMSYSTKDDELTGEVEICTCTDCYDVNVYNGTAYFLCDGDLCYSTDGQTYEVLAGDVDNDFTLYADSGSDRMLLWVEDEDGLGQISLYDKGEMLLFAEDVYRGNWTFRGSKGLMYIDDYDDRGGGTLKYFDGKDSQRLEEDVWSLGRCNEQSLVLSY